MTEKERRQQQGRSQQKGSTPDYPLEEREYRGKDGEIHHHTNVWMSRHGEEKGGGGRSQGGQGRESGQGGGNKGGGGQNRKR